MSTPPVVQTYDRASEFRIVIQGRFAGDCVRDTCNAWAAALKGSLGRKSVVDISHMTGYDTDGRKSLREMHLHGTEFAAATVTSLGFLAEITAPRRQQVMIIPETVPDPLPPGRETSRPSGIPRKAVAGGGK